MDGGGKRVAFRHIGRRVVDKSEHILIEECAVLVDEALICGIYREGGDSRAVGEGFARHIGQGCGKCDRLDLYTVLKCELSDIGKSDRERQGLNVFAVCKGVCADGADSIGEYDACKTRAAVEGIVADGCRACKVNGSNCGVAERGVSDRGNGRGEIDLRERDVAVKGVCGNAGQCAAVLEDDLGKRGASRKSGGADGLDLSGNGDALEALAVQERVSSDGGDRCGNVDALELGVVGKQAGGDAGHRVGETNRGEVCASVEHLIAEFAQLVTEDNGLKVGALIEDIHTGCGELTVLAEVNVLETGTAGEGVITDSCYGIGDVYGLQSVAVTERTCGNGSNAFFNGNVFQRRAADEYLVGHRANRTGNGGAYQLVTAVECLVSDGLCALGNDEARNSGTVECLVADLLEVVALECDGGKLGGTVGVECVISDVLERCGEDQHFNSTVAEGVLLDALQRCGKLDVAALELVECADLDGLNGVGKLEDALILNISGAVVQSLTVEAVDDTVLVLLHLCIAVGKCDRLNGIAVCEDGGIVCKEGSHTERELNGRQLGAVFKESRACCGYAVCDLEACKSGVREDLGAEVVYLAVTPVKGGHFRAVAECVAVNGRNVARYGKACQLVAREAVGRDHGHGRIERQRQACHVVVATECVRAHFLDARKYQGFDRGVVADRAVLEAYGLGIGIELDNQLGLRLGRAVLGLAGLVQVVNSVAVDRVDMRGELDVGHRCNRADACSEDGVVCSVGGDGVKGTDGKNGLTVVLIVLIKFLKNNSGDLGTKECLGVNADYACGNGYVTGLCGGAENDAVGVAHDGAYAEDTVKGVVDGICRINVDGGENCITAEHLVCGVVVVGLVVAAELLEVGGKGN